MNDVVFEYPLTGAGFFDALFESATLSSTCISSETARTRWTNL